MPDSRRQSQSSSRYASPPRRAIHATSGSEPFTFATMHSSSLSTDSSHQRRCRDAMTGATGTPQTRWRPRISTSSFRPTNLLIASLLLILAISPASAVQIKFQNCLSDSYRLNNPKPLQWEPLFADAVFDTKNPSHKLQVVVWGNVTGSQNQGTLPPPDDPYWEDPEKTNGKIVQVPNMEGARRTTLLRTVNFLTYEPFRQNVDFCVDALGNGQCPLAPIFSLDGKYVASFCCRFKVKLKLTLPQECTRRSTFD